MKENNRGSVNSREAEQQLRSLIVKFEPKYQTLIRAVRRALRKRFPAALELAYDYGKNLVIAYSPTETGSFAVVALSAGVDGLRLVFNNGPTLPDPKKILLGSGRATRFIWLGSLKDLTRPEVRALIAAATAQATIPRPKTGRGYLIVKTSKAKQKTRR